MTPKRGKCLSRSKTLPQPKISFSGLNDGTTPHFVVPVVVKKHQEAHRSGGAPYGQRCFFLWSLWSLRELTPANNSDLTEAKPIYRYRKGRQEPITIFGSFSGHHHILDSN